MSFVFLAKAQAPGDFGLNAYGKQSVDINEVINSYGEKGTGVLVSMYGKKAILSNGNGLTSVNAGTSAKQIKTDYPSSADGVYWITNPNLNSGTPFQIYADMTTDGGGWTLLNVGAGNTAAPVASTLTSPNVLGYLPRATVIELAKLCTDVQLRAGASSSSYANKTTSTSSLAIGALQSSATDVNGAGTWANGASSTFVVNSGSWLWAYCCPGVAAGWPKMYHSSNYTNGVHWFADLGVGRKNADPRDAWFSTWIR
ncbi:fibrinogen-like YCDxxxxGGGW domain-containing protein [Mariniflexile soesokkakense]|uniref:Fibrinogen-like YCDxxxxGGGW domain-containing protein n=1 Tax=Mariniflexile soesokkakense TaxID=1343160 RepID=A0ABV0ADE3_9FLAO